MSTSGHRTIEVVPTLQEVVAAYQRGDYDTEATRFFAAVLNSWDNPNMDHFQGAGLGITGDDFAVAKHLAQGYRNGRRDCTICAEPNCEIRVAFSLLDEYTKSQLQFA